MKKTIIMVLVMVMVLVSLSTLASAQIIETNGGYDYNDTTIDTNINGFVDYGGFEAAFTAPYGHLRYLEEVFNGVKTGRTQYFNPMKYITFQGESGVQPQQPIVNYPQVVNQQPVVVTTNGSGSEWRLITTVNGAPSYFVNSVTNQIIYVANQNVTSSSIYDPYGPYNPYDPGNYSNNNNSNSTDMYLNVNNTPKTTGASGCESYYLNTGNRTVKVHVTIPSGWRLIVGGVQIDNKSGVYDYFSSSCTKTIKNGFAILVPSNSLYSEFKARVQLARDNGWDCRYINWPQVSIN